MNTMKNSIALVLIALLILACSKEGNQGIQGEAGTDGQDGGDGQQGSQGETGTDNVIYSDWIPNNFSETPIAESSASFNIEE